MRFEKRWAGYFFGGAAIVGLAWMIGGDPTEEALDEALSLSYAELFDEAAGYEFSRSQIERRRTRLERDEDDCVDGFKDSAKDLNKQLRSARSDLRSGSGRLSDEERQALISASRAIQANRETKRH